MCIRFTATPLNAPRASRTGGRRTPRHSTDSTCDARAGRDLGNPGRSFAPGWWIAAAAPFAAAFWTIVAWILIERYF